MGNASSRSKSHRNEQTTLVYCVYSFCCIFVRINKLGGGFLGRERGGNAECRPVEQRHVCTLRCRSKWRPRHSRVQNANRKDARRCTCSRGGRARRGVKEQQEEGEEAEEESQEGEEESEEGAQGSKSRQERQTSCQKDGEEAEESSKEDEEKDWWTRHSHPGAWKTQKAQEGQGQEEGEESEEEEASWPPRGHSCERRRRW